MKSHYSLFVFLTFLFAVACTDDSNPTKSERKTKVVLKDISLTEFEREQFLSIHGSGFGDSVQGGYVLFGDVAARISTYNSSFYIGVYAPPNAYDGNLRVVFEKDTSNALPYKIKWKPEDYKILLSEVTKVIIYAKFYNHKEDTLMYELKLNEKFAYESDIIKLFIDTNKNAVKIIIPKYGSRYYEIWDGPPCDTSQKRRHSESNRYYDIPIKTSTENEFIARLEGEVGRIHIQEQGYTIEWHNTGRYCYPLNYVEQPPLKGSLKIIFQCK